MCWSYRLKDAAHRKATESLALATTTSRQLAASTTVSNAKNSTKASKPARPRQGYTGELMYVNFVGCYCGGNFQSYHRPFNLLTVKFSECDEGWCCGSNGKTSSEGYCCGNSYYTKEGNCCGEDWVGTNETCKD
eukprot:TRINITY_DN43933_c0_g1_i1.p2 TRINITY_DN43933_c0_g1~~TRINITY_DN43933_c0_g1_i1.p2  ORF type:complete len:134 (-),score=3.64 TRINITY_DN43933_c0_g1_i1:288-689(-)